jgi:FtsZ-binding cell division protein ZapB
MLDINNLKIPQMFIIKIDNIEDFFNTVFSIQASVSTMSIAIIALLSDAKKENLYGVSVLKYIMQEKPLILKHKRVVITIILLIFVNYIAVSLKFYNISIAIFFITIVLVGFMVFDIYEVFYGMDGIKLEIKQYLIKNCNENILGNLKKDLSNAIENSDNMRIGDNLDLFYNIMNSTLNDSKPMISKDRLEEIYVEIFQSLFNFGNSSRNLLGLRYLLQLLKLANNNMPNAALSIWDMLEQKVYQAISTIRCDELLETRIITELHNNLYLNTNMKRNEREIYIHQNNYDLKYYSVSDGTNAVM